MMFNMWIVLLWGLFFAGSLSFLNYFAAESKTRTIFIFLSFMGILSLIYYPGLTGHYIFHDDVFLWFWDKTHWTTHLQYRHTILCGRPLGAIVWLSVASFVDTVDSANMVRFFAVIIISLIALAVDIWFRRVCGLREVHSFFLVLLIVLLPPFQVYVYWISVFNIPVAILLSIYSLMLLFKLERNQALLVNILTFDIRNRNVLIGSSISLVLLLCSLMTYQAGATFFIALLAMWFMRVNRGDMPTVKWPWLPVTVFGVAATAYLGVFKILVPVNAAGLKAAYHNGLVVDYAGKLGWFFREPLMAAFNLWHVPRSGAVASIVLFVIVLGIVFDFIHSIRQNSNIRLFRKNFILKYLVILVFLFLSFGINLVVSTNGFSYRTITALITIVFILFWSGISKTCVVFLRQEQQERAITCLLFFIVTGVMILTHINFMRYCVDNNTQELNYVENELEKKYTTDIEKIHVVRPSDPPLAGKGSGDEFGITTCFFYDNIPWLVKAAFLERKIAGGGAITLSTGAAKDFVAPRPHLLIIDLGRRK
ncbi:MAG: hypothetical protein WCI27_01650 [Candidatus Omnitrophota bacterium]